MQRLHTFERSSYVQKEINMSEGLVNIDLPWHIPECTYHQRIYGCKSWSCCRGGMVAFGYQWLLSFLCGLKRRRAPSLLRRIIKARSYTRLVCRNHRLWWHDPLAQCFGVGGAKCISFLCIWACAKQGGVAKPRIVRGTFIFSVCVGAASDAMQN